MQALFSCSKHTKTSSFVLFSSSTVLSSFLGNWYTACSKSLPRVHVSRDSLYQRGGAIGKFDLHLGQTKITFKVVVYHDTVFFLSFFHWFSHNFLTLILWMPLCKFWHVLGVKSRVSSFCICMLECVYLSWQHKMKWSVKNIESHTVCFERREVITVQ